LVTEYRLAYTQSDATGRSTISGVSECAANNSCLPQLIVNWSSAGQAGWTAASGFTPPYYFDGDGYGDMGGRLVDLNGDGLPDFVYRRWYNCCGQAGAFLNTASGWTSAPQYSPPYYFSGDNIGDMGSRLIDLNGDGLPDFIFRRWYSPVGDYGAYLNNGNGWTSAPQYNPPFYFSGDAEGDMGSRLVDLNGDGLPDF